MSDDARITTLTAQLTNETARCAAERFSRMAGQLLDMMKHESPIERMLAVAFIFLETLPYSRTALDVSMVWNAGGTIEALAKTFNKHPDFTVMRQVKVGRYVLDFAVKCRINDEIVWAAIECDGHDFHEKTKQQAKKDKERDRYLQSRELIVLRYTGSEVWRDPIDVAVGALDLLFGLTMARAEKRELRSGPALTSVPRGK